MQFSPDLTQRAYEFVHHAHEIRSLTQLNTQFGQVLLQIGYKKFVSCSLVMSAGAPEPKGLFGRWGKQNEQHYVRSGHFNHDPMVSEAFNTVRSFAWSDVETTRQLSETELAVLTDMKSRTCSNGFVTPIHNVQGDLSTVILFGDQPDLSSEGRAVSHLASIYFNEFGSKLIDAQQKTVEKKRRLTSRQVDCLAWTARGLTRDEIGDRLCISPNTVTCHIEAAKIALNSRTTIQAVVKALRTNQVRL